MPLPCLQRLSRLSSSESASGSGPPKKSPSDFEFGKIIGEGSYSTVVLAREKKSGREFASNMFILLIV